MEQASSTSTGASSPRSRVEINNPDDISSKQLKSAKADLSIKVAQEYSRQIIAITLVTSYVILLATNIFLPTWLYLQNKPSDANLNISDIKDLTLTISSALSGLVGILGFIMGYYFKSIEQEQKESRKSQ